MTTHAITLLSRLHSKVAGLRQASAHFEDRLTPRFNALRLLGPSEVTLSNVLADLLSPVGSHGQKTVFLELFLKTFGFNEPWAKAHTAKVATEVATAYGRRIDIRIDFGKEGVIGIENKPWAGDQKLQIADYIAAIEKHHPVNRKMIYLTQDGRAPSEESTGNKRDFVKEGALVPVAYKQLIVWLEQCKGVCKSLRVGVFLDEFADYITKVFEGVNQMIERDTVVNELISNPAHIEAALIVSRAINNMKEKLLQILWEQLRNIILRNGRQWQFDVNFTLLEQSKWNGIFVYIKPTSQYVLALDFEQKNCNLCYIGVTHKGKDKLPIIPAVTQALIDIFSHGSASATWSWWGWFEHKDWNDNAEVWMSIPNGELAQKIFDGFEKIYSVLEQHNLLEELGWKDS